MKANAEHFFKAFEHCLNCQITKQQAMVMSKEFSKRGLIDASEGCAHYAMRLIDAMNIPEPKLVCKRHKWSSGWICDNCGMRRSDYESFRQADRPKYYIVNYGKNESRKFGHLHQAREFAFKYWHDGNEDFKAYNIVRVSNIGRRVVYQQTGDLLK